MGTVCMINLFEDGTRENYDLLFNRLEEIEVLFSRSLQGSDLWRVNASAGIGPVTVALELIGVLETALYYAERSGGLFNPALGPLIQLWAIGTGEARVPSMDEIEWALGLSENGEIVINRNESTIFLPRPGMALDLGAIAKGYALDELVLLLVELGIGRAIIDLGGDIYVHGEREEGSPWRVGIQDPRMDLGYYAGIFLAADMALATSGVYQRFLEEGGQHYHHLLSGHHGYPVENGIKSLTVVGRQGLDADALATAAFLLGRQEGGALLSEKGALGIFFFDDYTVGLYGDPALLPPGAFTLLAGEYSLLNLD